MLWERSKDKQIDYWYWNDRSGNPIAFVIHPKSNEWYWYKLGKPFNGPYATEAAALAAGALLLDNDSS